MHDSLGWTPERGEEMFHNYTETKAVAGHPRIKVLYWMHRARRDLVLQSSLSSSGLACLDGTPLIDLKPEHTTASD